MSEPTFAPEVVALLQEVARDSGSSLLRLPREPLSRWVARPEEVLSPRGSYLSKVEKHLVEAYREEAAWVLRQACIAQLARLPLVFSSSTRDARTLQSTARRLLREWAPATDGHSELLLLADGKAIGTVELGVASLRIGPCDSARNALAVALQRKGQGASALRLLETLLAGEPRSDQRAKALENMAHSWIGRGDFSRSYECNLEATRADESEIRFIAWCMTSALQAGEEASARRESARLERHPEIGRLPSVAQALVDGRSGGLWRPTEAGREAAARLRTEAVESVQEICDAFL